MGRSGAVILLVISGLLVAYPLSFGPVAVIYSEYESDISRDVFHVAYEPLRHLPDTVQNGLNRWAILCWELWRKRHAPIP